MDNEANGARTGAQNRSRSKPEETTKRRKTTRSKCPSPQERVAMIGALALIIAAMIPILPSLITQFRRNPTPTSIPIITVSPTAFIADPITPSRTATLTQVITPSPIFTPTLILSPTDTATIEPTPGPLMIAILVADKTSGRQPLTIKFDARDSVLHEPNGTQISCRAGACFYSWKVYANGQQIGRGENNSVGRFEYTFRKRGTYTVTVYVCRGQDRIDCGGNGMIIAVT